MTLLGYFSPQTAGQDPTIQNPNVPGTYEPDPTKYQNLSYQSNFYVDYAVDCPNLNITPAPTTPTDVVEFSFSPVAGLNNIVTALAYSTNPVHLSASFGVAPNQICAGIGPAIGGSSYPAGQYPYGDIVRKVVSGGGLDSIAIPSVDMNQTIAPLGTQQFYAIGTFLDSNAHLLGTQDITSLTTWSVDVPTQVTISNTSGTSGFATSVLNVPGCVNVVAINKSAASIPSFTTPLMIGSPGYPPAACLPPPAPTAPP